MKQAFICHCNSSNWLLIQPDAELSDRPLRMRCMNCTEIMWNELKKTMHWAWPVLPPKNSDGVWTCVSRHLEWCCFASAWYSVSSLVLAETTVVRGWSLGILDIMLKCGALKTAILMANVLIHILLLQCLYFCSKLYSVSSHKKAVYTRVTICYSLKKTKTFCVDQLMFYIEGSEPNLTVL